jgi:hypothetical protein
MSAERYRSVVIAMAIMWVMQPSVHKVIDVITVRHLFVSAARTMRMRAGLERAAHGLDNMFVDIIFMHGMQMTIVQIIDMVVMAHSRVPTVGTMLMCVIRMMPLGAGGHLFAHLSWVLSDRASQCCFLGARLNLSIRPVCSQRDIPNVMTGCDTLAPSDRMIRSPPPSRRRLQAFG